MDSHSLASAYDEFYFSHNGGRARQRDEEWRSFFGAMADRIVRDIGPATVLDAGCALGFLVEALRARGVDAGGVDISEYAIENAHADVRPYCWLGSVTDTLAQRYDLIVCVEVLENLPPHEADEAIENFCKHADDILFSSTPFNYKEATHLNVRPPAYWAQRFARYGFFRDIDFDATFITPWAVRFRKTCEPAWRVVYDYERYLWQLEKEVQARRQLTIEQLGRLAEGERHLHALAEKEQTLKARAAEIAAHRATIDSLTAQLQHEQERAQQLLAQEAERLQTISQLSARLSAQDEKIAALIAPMVSRQTALESSVAELLASRNAIEALVAQLAAKEQTALALSAQLAGKEQAIRTLEAQATEAAATVERLTVMRAESDQTIRALAAELAERDQALRTFASRAKGTEVTISALSQRLAEQEQALERQRVEHERELASQRAEYEHETARQRAEHEQIIERFKAVLAERGAQLADVNNSLAWYVYNRIKYPYLIALFRLYERIKYPYLMFIYRRLGLASGVVPPPQPAPQLTEPEAQLALAEQQQQPPPTLAPPPNLFPVPDVASPSVLRPHNMRVDVIVCVHNALEDVRRCLESVVRHTRMPYTLILVDDGSDEETRAYLSVFAQSQGAALVRNEAAKGYTFAANQGLRRSRGHYVVLLNSDTVVTPLWLDRMIACAESDPRIGLVGPLSNVASWQSIPDIARDGDWAENKLPEGLSVADMGRLVGQYSARVYPRLSFLNGFCLMIKDSVLEQVGYFDEELFGRGYGEENDYCLRARKAGWQLGVADDTYVYHAQSRSYSHERRKELSRLADVALTTKHEPQMIYEGVAQCRADRVLEGIRARSRAMLEREQLTAAGLERWEGKRVTFILTINSACGGGNVVLDEAEAMRKMGVNARVLNLSRNRVEFERSYPHTTVPVVYMDDESQLTEVTSDCDAVVATACDTVYWLKPVPGAAHQPLKAYYVQDFEPYFFRPELPGFRIAWNSYTEHPDVIRLTKTEWNRAVVRNNTGVDCAVVGPCVNIDLYRPRKRRDPDWPVRPLRIAAMIRPSTPRRNPKLTMEVLREHARAHGETVEIILFGCEASDPDFLALPHDFTWRNAGMLSAAQVAALLNEVDIFADFSEFQAMGLTAMEAMACGAAVIVPQKGGAESFATHEQNALVVDTSSPESCLATLERLTMDEKLRARLQQQAIIDACKYYPERAAYNMLDALFPARR